MIPEELKTQIEKEAEAEMIYEPKYGSKDHSGYETMMKYEVNDERYDAYEKGALKYAELWQEGKDIIELYEKALKSISNGCAVPIYTAIKALTDVIRMKDHALK